MCHIPVSDWLLVAFAAQIAALVSPAAYRHTRRGTGTACTSVALVAGGPKPWLLPWSLLAGLALTLMLLGQMAPVALPGCGPAGSFIEQLPERCRGLAEGHPLRFLLGDHSIPRINKMALVKDWAQWSLVSATILYVFNLIRAGRNHASDAARAG